LYLQLLILKTDDPDERRHHVIVPGKQVKSLRLLEVTLQLTDFLFQTVPFSIAHRSDKLDEEGEKEKEEAR
jgi:hypothetical protein